MLVPSESTVDTSYLVDMEMRHCSCPQGQLRGPCKHKLIVSVSKNVPSFDVIPTKNPEMRKLLMYLGTGKNMDMNWFLPLQAPSVPTSVSCPVSRPEPETSLDGQESQAELGEHLDTPAIVSQSEVKIKLETVMKHLHDKLAARIQHDPSGYEKALAAMDKTVQRLPSTVDSALQKCLYTFGKSVTEVMIVLNGASCISMCYIMCIAGLLSQKEKEDWTHTRAGNSQV